MSQCLLGLSVGQVPCIHPDIHAVGFSGEFLKGVAAEGRGVGVLCVCGGRVPMVTAVYIIVLHVKDHCAGKGHKQADHRGSGWKGPA